MAAEGLSTGILSKETPLAQSLGVTSEQRASIAQLAHDFHEQGRLEDARTLFAGLVGLDEEDFYGQAGLGAVLLDLEQIPEAVEHLERAIALWPQEAGAHACLGEAYLHQARFEEAARELRTAIELDPEEKHAGAGRARGILGSLDTLIDEVVTGGSQGIPAADEEELG